MINMVEHLRVLSTTLTSHHDHDALGELHLLTIFDGLATCVGVRHEGGFRDKMQHEHRMAQQRVVTVEQGNSLPPALWEQCRNVAMNLSSLLCRMPRASSQRLSGAGAGATIRCTGLHHRLE